MNVRIISITFSLEAQRHKGGQFTVPKSICRLLGLTSGDEIALVIESTKGTLEITTRLRSGEEIYGAEIREYVQAGERIRVTASRPDFQ